MFHGVMNCTGEYSNTMLFQKQLQGRFGPVVCMQTDYIAQLELFDEHVDAAIGGDLEI